MKRREEGRVPYHDRIKLLVAVLLFVSVGSLLAGIHFCQNQGPIDSLFDQRLGILIAFAIVLIGMATAVIYTEWHQQKMEFMRKESEAEHQIRRLNRIYSVLSNINQAIVRIRDRQQLLEETCKIGVEDGGLRMVWVGFIDQTTHHVFPVASAGDSGGYLDGIVISIDDIPEGRGPVGTALREGHPVICSNIKNDKLMEPWQDNALRQGFASLASFPLQHNAKLYGAINLYSSELSFFDEEEVKLLTELAEDVSFALYSFDREAEREHAEQQLRGARDFNEQILANVEVGIGVFDKDGICLLWNPFMHHLVGTPGTSAIGKSSTDLLPGIIDIRSLSGQVLSGASVPPLSIPYNNTEGKSGWITGKINPLKNIEGGVEGIVFIANDITEMKLAETKLRQLSLAVEQSPASIVITDTAGNIAYVNFKFTEITGYTFEEVRGRNPRILKSGLNPPELYQSLWESITHGTTWQGEMHNRKKNGELFWEYASISPIVDEAGATTHFLAIKEDITRRKAIEEQLREIQKLESIGTLAGGIAHDFNNILGIILGHSSLIQRRVGDDEKLMASVQTIGKSVQRGADLVRQILTFARKSDVLFEPVSINESVSEMERMMSETFPKSVETVLCLEEHLPPIEADRTQIHQVLLNLCVNARDAMPQGGTLTMRTKRVHDQTILERFGDVHHKHYIHLSVTDTGAGMDEATRLRIFEPFFTTKEKGKGTGLGLSVVYGIITSHRGYIEVESMPGSGTTFHVYFPVMKGATQHITDGATHATEIAGGTETILIVEDEEMLRNLLSTFLKNKGYTIMTASNGDEGVDQYRIHSGRISLVISDIGLPRQDGVEVYHSIRRANPRAKVILASGYFEPSVKTMLLAEGASGFIHKPYKPDEILQKVREVLDKN